MFDFSHLWAQAAPIPAHALLAMVAIPLGGAQLLAPKGGARHRIFGYLWAALMIGVALTAAFISELKVWGPFSPIHLMIPVTLISLWVALRAARSGNIRRHRITMLSLFGLALIVTGFFTLLPGRAMHAVLFGA